MLKPIDAFGLRLFWAAGYLPLLSTTSARPTRLAGTTLLPGEEERLFHPCFYPCGSPKAIRVADDAPRIFQVCNDIPLDSLVEIRHSIPQRQNESVVTTMAMDVIDVYGSDFNQRACSWGAREHEILFPASTPR